MSSSSVEVAKMVENTKQLKARQKEYEQWQESISNCLEEQKTNMDTKFQNQNSKLDNLEEKMQAQGTKLDALIARINAVMTKAVTQEDTD
eukprot:4768075-Ditylum_brightwellii.AAC.1